jgi:hypothetical protein
LPFVICALPARAAIRTRDLSIIHRVSASPPSLLVSSLVPALRQFSSRPPSTSTALLPIDTIHWPSHHSPHTHRSLPQASHQLDSPGACTTFSTLALASRSPRSTLLALLTQPPSTPRTHAPPHHPCSRRPNTDDLRLTDRSDPFTAKLAWRMQGEGGGKQCEYVKWITAGEGTQQCPAPAAPSPLPAASPLSLE